MTTNIPYDYAQANFAALCDEVTSTREPIVIERQGSEAVAVVPAAELQGLMETAHLLRSPRNAQRLLTALIRAQEQQPASGSVEELRRELGLGQTS